MRIFIVLLTGLLLFSPTLLPTAFAQKTATKSDPKAKKILDQVSKKYKTLRALKADFTLSIENTDANIKEKQKGRVYIKGNKYKIETDKLDRISDNKSVWTHFKDEEEVQVTEFDPDEGELTPAQLFTIYDRDFIYSLNDEVKERGIAYAMIDLTPKDKSVPYYKVRLTVNKDNSLITRAMVFEKNSTTVVYELGNFNTDVTFEDSFFSFKKDTDSDIEVIDLR